MEKYIMFVVSMAQFWPALQMFVPSLQFVCDAPSITVGDTDINKQLAPISLIVSVIQFYWIG